MLLVIVVCSFHQFAAPQEMIYEKANPKQNPNFICDENDLSDGLYNREV
jgi:hypothetical protein